MNEPTDPYREPLLDETGRPAVWWASLPSVPDDPDSAAYLRLRRIWADHTLGRDRHPLTEPGDPLGMTARLFENFRLYFPQTWLGALLYQVGWTKRTWRLHTARWSYGYEAAEHGPPLMCDLVIHARDSASDFIIIGKALPRGTPLTTDGPQPEHLPGTWLDRGEFTSARRHLMLYLVDEADAAQVAARIEDPHPEFDPGNPDSLDHYDPPRHAILTWQDLAGMQIRLALDLPIPQIYRSYIASTIQWQYAQHDIRPSQLAFDYLAGEKSFDAIHPTAPGKQTLDERRDPLWRLDPI